MATILVLAMLLAVIIVPGVHTIAEEEIVETVPTELYQNGVTVGETLIEEDFEGEGAALPTDWQYGKAVGFWVGGTSSVTTPYVENGALYYNSSGCDALIGMPAISASDYVYEADLICAGWSGSFGLFNNMPAGTKIGTDSAKACLNFLYIGKNDNGQLTYYQRGQGGGQVYVDGTGFELLTPTENSKVNLKIYCINGMNYYYVDDVLRAAYKQLQPQGASSILGFYTCQAKFGIDKVTVKALDAFVPEEIADVEAGDTIYDLADDLGKTEVGAVPEGWVYGGAGIADAAHKLPFGYPSTTGSQTVGLKVAESDGTKVLNFTSSGCDAVAVGPEILPSSYIYEATIKAAGDGANVGLSNATWGAETASELKSADWFVAKPGVNASYYVSRNGKGVVSGVRETKLSYGSGDTIVANKEYNFKIICLDGTNYYFINDRYYGTHTPTSFITNYSDGTGGRLGLYTNVGNMTVSAMTVKEIKEEEVIFLPEALEKMGVTIGDSVLYEDFEDAAAIPEGFELRNPTWDGWPGTAGSMTLSTYQVNGKNDKGLNVVASQDDVILIPTINTKNYVYEAEITLTNNVNGSYGILNDMSVKVRESGADAQGQSGDYGANRMVIYTMAHGSGKANAYWQNRFQGGASQTNVPKPAGLDTLPVTNTTLNFKVYTFNGINYFYINDIFIASFNNLKNFGPENVLGIFTSSAPIFVSKVSVKALNEPESNLGMADGKAFLKGEVLYELDPSKLTVGQAPEGWNIGYSAGTGDNKTSFGYTNTNTMTAEKLVFTTVEDSDLGTVVKAETENADTHMTIPQIGTLNYIYEATVKVSRGGSLGPANNYYASVNKATGGFYNVNYVNSTANVAKYDYRGSTSGTSKTWDINCSPKAGDIVKYKIVSLDGYNYMYYNDVFVAKAPVRTINGTPTVDHPGFYMYNAGMLISEVKVTAIHSVDVDVKNTFITVDGSNVDLNAKFEVDKSQSLYKEFVDGEYVYSDDAAVKFGAVVLKADEKAFADLTVDTENAQVIDATVYTETDDALRYALTLDVASADYQKWYNIRPFALVDGTYFYGDGVAYTAANLSNTAYYNADDEGKAEVKAIFGSYSEFIYGDKVNSITFTAYADLHYKAGMYPASMSDVKSIFKRADDSNSVFILSAGDMTNDMKGSPELYNYFKGYVTEEGELLKAYNIYGNHELESGNSMADVTPTLTNDANVVWGTADGKMDVSIAYYYTDVDGFRLIGLDNNYDYNPNHYLLEDGSMGEVVGWEHYRTGSYGGTSAATNATRGFYEGADAVANTSGGSLGDVQKAWLEKVLLDAAEKDIPCIVVGHAGYSGLGFGGGSGDSADVRAIYKKANDANPGTVLMSINGHIHTNNQGWNDGVFYLDLNTVRNTWWKQTSGEHYSAQHTYTFEEYDDAGNYVGTTEKPLTSLGQSTNTWFSADPLSAVITLSDNGVIEIDGTESSWAYDVVPDLSAAPAGTEPRISSGLFIDCDIYGHALTCVEDGDGHYNKCANPKCDYREDTVAHVFDKEVASDKYKETDADCKNLATYNKSCVCGAEGNETFSAGVLGDHSFADGCCSVCEGKLGDVNGDKVVNIFDLVKVKRIIDKLDGAN
ncbi:MAG: hypothetical protein IJW27_00390, partial [Clostridia bacterium]|nr:hypothetical protein [Clostridia bacterium]